MQKLWDSVSDTTGKAIIGAQIVVKNAVSGIVATIYNADNPIAGNEITELLTNSEGYFEFYAPDGRYTLEIYYGGILKKTIADLILEDPVDESLINTNGGIQKNVDIQSGIIRSGVVIEGNNEKIASISSVDRIDNVDTSGLVGDEQFLLRSWAPGAEIDGAILYWDETRAKSAHDGRTVYSPTVPPPADFTSQANIDDYIAGVGETDPGGTGCFVALIQHSDTTRGADIATAFAPHQTQAGAMKVIIDAGVIATETGFVSKAAQTSAIIAAPVTNPRKDLIEIDAATGVLNIVTGAEAASPAVPAMTAAAIPLGIIDLTVGMTKIVDADITIIRPIFSTHALKSDLADVATDSNACGGVAAANLINNFDNNQAIDASASTTQQAFILGSASITNYSRLVIKTDQGQLFITKGGSTAGSPNNTALYNGNDGDFVFNTGSSETEQARIIHQGGFKSSINAPATPTANTLYADSMIKAWAYVSISAGTPSITTDFNIAVSGVTDLGVGNFTLTLATGMANSTHAASVTAVGGGLYGNMFPLPSPTSTTVRCVTYDDAGNSADGTGFTMILAGPQ